MTLDRQKVKQFSKQYGRENVEGGRLKIPEQEKNCVVCSISK